MPPDPRRSQPMLNETRDATVRKAIDLLMARHGCQALGPQEDEDGRWRDVWLKIDQGNPLGLKVIYLGLGHCVAIDIDTQHEIGRGDGLAGVANDVLQFYDGDKLGRIHEMLDEVGSRA